MCLFLEVNLRQSTVGEGRSPAKQDACKRSIHQVLVHDPKCDRHDRRRKKYLAVAVFFFLQYLSRQTIYTLKHNTDEQNPKSAVVCRNSGTSDISPTDGGRQLALHLNLAQYFHDIQSGIVVRHPVQNDKYIAGTLENTCQPDSKLRTMRVSA